MANELIPQATAIGAKVDALELRLMAASEREIEHAVGVLLMSLPAGQVDEGVAADIRLESYMLACRGMPLWAIQEARDAFRAGRVATHKSSFCPSSADFGREIESRVSMERLRLQRARRQRNEEQALRETEIEPEQVSQATRDRVAIGLQRLRAASAEERKLFVPAAGSDADKFAAYRGRIGANGQRLPRPAEPKPIPPLTEEDVVMVPDADPRPAPVGTMRPVRGFNPLAKNRRA